MDENQLDLEILLKLKEQGFIRDLKTVLKETQFSVNDTLGKISKVDLGDVFEVRELVIDKNKLNVVISKYAKETQKLISRFVPAEGYGLDLIFGNSNEISKEFQEINENVFKGYNYINRKLQSEQKKKQVQDEIAAQSAKQSTLLSNWATIFSENLTGKDLERFQLQSLKDRLKELKREYLETGDTGKEAFEKVKTEVKQVQDEIAELEAKLQLKKMSGLTKLVNTFKRVGFYRIARRFFQLIEQGVSESFQQLAQYSPSINNTLSSISSQFAIMSNSLATMIVPFLQLIEPILKVVATTMGEIATVFSYLISLLTKSATYFKINTEYLKEFNKQANKFSFDKFEALNAQDNIIEEVSVSEGLPESLQKVSDILISILGTITAIGVAKFIDWIISGNFKEGLTKLAEKLGSVDDKFKNIAGYAIAFYSLYEGIKGIIDIIKNWKDMSTLEKWKNGLKSVLYILAGIVALIGVFKKDYKMVVTAGAIVAGVEIGNKIGLFANGGMVDSGSLFIAGESGAEFVTTMPSGQTGVTNIAQFKEAQLQALSTWWAYAKYDLPESATFNLDGATIARSKRFKDELNRTNAGLNLQ